MASTYTTRNRLEKQGVGDNPDTWGTRLNERVFDMVDEALDGYISIDVAGSGDYTLSANNGTTDEARQRIIFLTGALTGTRNIVLPAVEGWRIFWNGTSGDYDLNIKASGGSSTKLPKGQMGVFICYGSSTDNLLPGACGWDQESYAVASGTDTYTATLIPDPGEYLLGETVHIKFTNANTGAATLNLNSNGAKAIQRDGSALTAGEIAAGSTHELVYDGTQFQLTGVSNLTSKLVGTIATSQIASNAVNGSKIAMGSDAQGDILYYDGTDYARLAASTSGYILKTQGAGANPTWFNHLDVAQTWTKGQRGEVTTLSDGANISINLADSNNFTVTLAGNRTLDNPTNIVAGQSGVITVVQDATGSRTLAYGTYYKFQGGTTPVLSTAANAIDVLSYYVKSATEILISASYDWS